MDWSRTISGFDDVIHATTDVFLTRIEFSISFANQHCLGLPFLMAVDCLSAIYSCNAWDSRPGFPIDRAFVYFLIKIMYKPDAFELTLSFRMLLLGCHLQLWSPSIMCVIMLQFL